jgi:hypothetical protein
MTERLIRTGTRATHHGQEIQSPPKRPNTFAQTFSLRSATFPLQSDGGPYIFGSLDGNRQPLYPLSFPRTSPLLRYSVSKIDRLYLSLIKRIAPSMRSTARVKTTPWMSVLGRCRCHESMNRNPDDKHTATELNRAQNLEALKIDLRMICLSISGSLGPAIAKQPTLGLRSPEHTRPLERPCHKPTLTTDLAGRRSVNKGTTTTM